MEVIRKFIDANSLMSIMTLPETFRNQKLEVIVLPADEQTSVKREESTQDIVQSLIGAIPYTSLSLKEFRDERLEKYEASD